MTLFRESVVPALREQEGYEGVYVLLSDEGKVLALTFWESEEAADAGIVGGAQLLRGADREVRDALPVAAGTGEVQRRRSPTHRRWRSASRP